MQVSLQLLATAIMETLAVWILRICVYIIFIVQVIYSTVLIILGPFSVAMSILSAFRDSFSTWIARFISVNLYAGIAYLVMCVGSLFQRYVLEDRKSVVSGRSGSVRVELGGDRPIYQKKQEIRRIS